MNDIPHYSGAWKKTESSRHDFAQTVCKYENMLAIGKYTHRHAKRGPILQMKVLGAGSYNVAVQFDMKDQSTPQPVVRIPFPAATMFPEEKTHSEAEIMRYLYKHLSVKVPRVLHVATKPTDGPLALGPCIIMESCENHTCISRVLDGQKDLTASPKERIMLKSSVSVDLVERMYGHIAAVLVQLWQPDFDLIGSGTYDGHSLRVTGRPLTLNMNDLVQLGGVPASELPQRPFHTSRDYFISLADQHMSHLRHLNPSFFRTADDWRKKYVARVLFRKLAATGHLSSQDKGPFKLFNEDLCPTQFLLDKDLDVAGVIDWEFTNVLPREFAACAPWWLLLRRPEAYPGGAPAWSKDYYPRLQTFLHAMRKEEDKRGLSHERLSDLMEKSWETGDFWVLYAARDSFWFDPIFWVDIVERFYGTRAWRKLVREQLTTQERGNMEASIPKELLSDKKIGEIMVEEVKSLHVCN